MIETFDVDLPHGIRLACRASGTPGRPVMMFLHGFPEGAFVWDTHLAHFARPENGGYRCVAPWLRGFAPSSAPTAPQAYAAKHVAHDLAALIRALAPAPGAPLAALVAHDWGGAVGWLLANQCPQDIERVVIVNAPHAATLLREFQHNPAQQAASAYMNFLIRPDAEALLAEDDYRRLWGFFARQGSAPPWLTEPLRAQYRATWAQGLTGPCNYYRATPLRPSRPGDPACAAVVLPPQTLGVTQPTLVVWAMDDAALPPALLDGLDAFVPDLTVRRVAGASHWIVHEQPEALAGWIGEFLQR